MMKVMKNLLVVHLALAMVFWDLSSLVDRLRLKPIRGAMGPQFHINKYTYNLDQYKRPRCCST